MKKVCDSAAGMDSPYADDSIRVHQTNSSYDARKRTGLSNLTSQTVHATVTSKAPHDVSECKPKQTIECDRLCETTSAKAIKLNDFDKTSICDSTQRTNTEQLKRFGDFNKISPPIEQDRTSSLQQQYYVGSTEPPMKVQIVSMVQSQPDTKLVGQSETCEEINADKGTVPMHQGCPDNFYCDKTATKEHTEHVTLIYPQSDQTTQELSFVTSDSSDAFIRHKTTEELNLSNETAAQNATSGTKENTTQQTYHELTPVNIVTTQYAPHAYTSTPFRDNNQRCQNNSESYSDYLDSETPDKPKNVSGIGSCMEPTFYYQQKQENELCNASAQEIQTKPLNAETIANQQIYYVTSTEKSDQFYTRNEQADKETGSG